MLSHTKNVQMYKCIIRFIIVESYKYYFQRIEFSGSRGGVSSIVVSGKYCNISEKYLLKIIILKM